MIRFSTTWLVAVLATMSPAAALAAPALPPQTITGGGGSMWEVHNAGGTDNGLPTGGNCDFFTPGLAMSDAYLPANFDAYDNGLSLWVNNSIFVAPGTIDLTTTGDGTFYTAGPVAQSGLDVTMQYFIDADTPTARTFASFSNPTGAAIAVQVSWVTNVGSDSGTQIITTGSGDTTFTTADRYIITDDFGQDPANTHVLFGPGSPAVTPSSVSSTVFNCADTQGVLATYNLNVPAGATQHLLFFNELDATSAGAVAGVSVYDSNASITAAGLFAGLSNTQLASTVNYTAVPEPASLALLALGAMAISFSACRRKTIV